MDEQRFIYDSRSASGAAARAADHARKRGDVSVVDVAEDRTRHQTSQSYDRRDVVDTYQQLLLEGPDTLDAALGSLADVDPAEGIFVGLVDGQQQVVTGEEALAALSDLESTV